jgi:hypothetical protein
MADCYHRTMSNKYRPKRMPRIRRARPLLVAVGAVMLTVGCNDHFSGVMPCNPNNPQEDCNPHLDMNVSYDLGLTVNHDGGK